MTNIEAYALANRMARHAHCDWLVWKTDDGEFHAAKQTLESVREAIKAVSPTGEWSKEQRDFTLVSANNTIHSRVYPGFALVMLRNAEAGYL